MESNYSDPINLGNPDEYTMLEFAKYILKEVGKQMRLVAWQGMNFVHVQRRKEGLGNSIGKKRAVMALCLFMYLQVGNQEFKFYLHLKTIQSSEDHQ